MDLAASGSGVSLMGIINWRVGGENPAVTKNTLLVV